MSKEPLSYVDAAWLHMEDPTNLMMVTGIMTFDRPINLDHLRAVLTDRFLKYKRFRQRVVESSLLLGTPHWETDPNFDLNAHIHRVALPEPADQTALQDMVSDLMSVPLDFSKPLWQYHVVENYGEGGAIITRLHHCIADGIALMQVLLALTDLSADAPWPKPKPKKRKQSSGLLGMAYETFIKPATSAFTTARQITEKLVSEGSEALSHPSHLLELAQQGTDAALAASRLVLLPPDPKTIFKGKLGVSKRAAWSRPLPLADVKAIKNATNTTVNDVLVSALAGGLHRYLVDQGQPVDDLNFRAFVPVNIRPPEQVDELGNKFGLVLLSLPIFLADPLERLAEVHKRMETLKNTPEAVVAFGILGAMGMTPTEVQRVIVQIFGMKGTAVMTNVPGPQIPLYLAGSRIKEIMFWVPQSGHVALGTSIISYANEVRLGVVTDMGLIANPDAIIDGFYDEYDQLLSLVRQAESLEVIADPAPITPPTPPDDLTRIKGIGPKVAQLLEMNGIASYATLSETDTTILQALLDEAGPRYRLIDPANWSEEARTLLVQ